MTSADLINGTLLVTAILALLVIWFYQPGPPKTGGPFDPPGDDGGEE